MRVRIIIFLIIAIGFILFQTVRHNDQLKPNKSSEVFFHKSNEQSHDYATKHITVNSIRSDNITSEIIAEQKKIFRADNTNSEVLDRNFNEFGTRESAYGLLNDKNAVCCAVDKDKVPNSFKFKGKDYIIGLSNLLNDENDGDHIFFKISFKEDVTWLYPERFSVSRTEAGNIYYNDIIQNKFKTKISDQILKIPTTHEVLEYLKPFLYKQMPDLFKNADSKLSNDANICSEIVIVPQGTLNGLLVNLAYCHRNNDFIKIGLAIFLY